MSAEEFAGPQSLRRVHTATLLRFAWDTGAFTATDAMEATGLTRTTVLSLCDELVGLGWLRELPSARAGESSKGRPARRYAFLPGAGHVLGVDAGQHRVTAAVADLRGVDLARSSRTVEEDPADPGARLHAIDAAVADALDAAGASEESVLAAVVGVPAPVDHDGRSPDGHDGYWPRMNPGIAGHLRRDGRRVVVDNDANLAAVAEGSVGAGSGASSFVTLLSGERFGAGLIVEGVLLRGRFGGAGEMHFLDMVQGVGSAEGLGALARMWDGRGLADVIAAAEQGDETATAVLERLGDRLARISAVLTGLLDVERVIVGGATAAGAGPVIERARAVLATYMHLPVPELLASDLGADGVTIGAVQHAVSVVRDDPLAFDVRAGSAGAQPVDLQPSR